jgi:hypothetical protein
VRHRTEHHWLSLYFRVAITVDFACMGPCECFALVPVAWSGPHGDHMKSADVYSVRAQTAHGFVWKWRPIEGLKRPSMAFVCYEDCVADAQKSGYVVSGKPPPSA